MCGIPKTFTCQLFVVDTMVLPEKCVFNMDWTNLELPQHASWIRLLSGGTTSAFCSLCCKKFSLSNIGNRAPICLSSPVGGECLMAAVGVLTDHRWLPGAEPEGAQQLYAQICSPASTQAAFEGLNKETDQPDKLLLQLRAPQRVTWTSFV